MGLFKGSEGLKLIKYTRTQSAGRTIMVFGYPSVKHEKTDAAVFRGE